jgi:hypothetical protein
MSDMRGLMILLYFVPRLVHHCADHSSCERTGEIAGKLCGAAEARGRCSQLANQPLPVNFQGSSMARELTTVCVTREDRPDNVGIGP